MVLETERKFEAPSTLAPDALAQVTGYANPGMEEVDLAAEYFDTEDLRLLRSGVTLRRRTGGHDAGWHLKMPEGRDSRTEIQLPLTGSSQPPSALLEATRVYTLGAELVPVATLNTHRMRWPLLDLGGHEVAELVDDVVSAFPAGTIAAPQSWREVEVELREGIDTSVLDVIEARLASLGVNRARDASKLVRALHGRIPARRPPRIGKKTTAGEVVVEYLRTQADALRHFDPLAREDVPDAVHQMRVAARRMRGALQSFGDVLDRDRTRELVTELRWMAGELAPARDAEVMTERFAGVLAGLPSELKIGPVETETEVGLRARTASAHESVSATLTGARYLELHRGIDALLRNPPFTRRARRRAQATLTAGIRKAFDRLEGRMAVVERSEAGPARELALHDARKAAKRLRYAGEVAAPVLGKQAIRLRKRLESVQSVLGEHQDAVVARATLIELGAQADRTGGHGFSYGVMHGIETARAAAAERDLDKAWKRARAAARRC